LTRAASLCALAIVFCCVSIGGIRAQTGTINRDIKAVPGRDVRVGIFSNIRSDCTSGPLPAIRLAVPPTHGNVTVKRGTLKATNIHQCLATEVPVFVAFYRAVPDYSGADSFDLEISFSTGRKAVEHVSVSVANDSGRGQGI
jgi:hypothetical protein